MLRDRPTLDSMPVEDSGDRTEPADPQVDVVIAVHTSTRPIARAAASALRNDAAVRVTVVAHNIDASVIRSNLGDLADDPRVRLLHLHDGIPSPAGPMNLGFAHATGEFVSLLGSDDEFEVGALDAWLDIASREGADVVIAPINDLGRTPDPYPPIRRGRTSGLDPDRDRLAYRSAPLGLVSRARFGHLRFAEGLGSGEDLPFVTSLWFTGAAISFHPTSPGYLGHIDEPDRVTAEPRPLADDFLFLDFIERGDAFPRMRRRERVALVVKILRIHVFDAIAARVTDDGFPEDQRRALSTVLRKLRGWAPGATALLAWSDSRALKAALQRSAPAALIRERLDARWRYGSPATLIASNPLLTLHRHAPFRTLSAGIRVRGASAAAIAARGGQPHTVV